MQTNTPTHIYFLLDRTGSMEPMATDVIGGFNGFLAAQRANGDDARMTLVQFDSQDPFEVLSDAKALGKVKDLDPTTYVPRGGTPLLDATGDLIAHASKRVTKRKRLGKAKENILFVTFTDGEENASSRCSRADITRLVAQKQGEGWTFVFLGAGIDAYAESGSIGYAPGSVQAWAPDGKGAKLAFHSMSEAVTRHRDTVRAGAAPAPAQFFDGKKEAEADRQQRHGS